MMSGMSKNHPVYGPFPGLDDHLVEPEVTRDQIIGGRLVVDEPSELPEAILKSRLNFVLGSHVAPGYLAAAGLLTRFDWGSDFGSDSCLYKEGVDPETGGRYLEEITFEVVSEQNERDATEKAFWMHRRGVRRIFMVEVEDQQVCEWSADRQSWLSLDPRTQIEDPCLVIPVPVAALFDKTAASIAAMKGMAAQGNPEIQRREAAARAEAKAEGKAEVDPPAQRAGRS
jgi:hypothetical protein